MAPGEKKDDGRKHAKNYMQYTGMAFQLLGLIAVAVIAGQELDARADTPKPYFTAGLVVFFLLGYLIKMYYDLTSNDRS